MKPPYIITPDMTKDRDEYLVLISNITGIPADDELAMLSPANEKGGAQ